MIIIPGHCVKCGCDIARSNRASHMYEHINFKMEGGGKMAVGICKSCDIEPSEYEELMTLFNDYMRVQNPGWKDDPRKILSVDSREGIGAIVLKNQGNKCVICHGEIHGNYIMTNGQITHEDCAVLKTIPRPLLKKELTKKDAVQP